MISNWTGLTEGAPELVDGGEEDSVTRICAQFDETLSRKRVYLLGHIRFSFSQVFEREE